MSVKVIRDKNTGLPAGYGFVEFNSHEIATQVLACYNSAPIPGTNKSFRLNWGIFGGGTKTTTLSSAAAPMQKMVQSAANPDFSIYVGDIDAQVNDMMLLEFFQKRYKSVVSAKVIVDPITKYSKGYGFVKFSNFEESQRAISEMQGSLLRGRHIKTSQSFWKSANQDQAGYMSSAMGMGSTGVASPQVQPTPPTSYPQTQVAANNPAMPNYYMNYYNSLMGNNTNSASYYEAMLPYLQGYQNNTNVAQPDMGYGAASYGQSTMNTGMDSYYQHPQQAMGGGMGASQYGQNMMQQPQNIQMMNNQPANAYGNPTNYQTNYQQLAASLTNYPSQNKPLGVNNMQMGLGQNQNINKAGGAYANTSSFHGYNTTANQIVQQDLINNAQISTNYGNTTLLNNAQNQNERYNQPSTMNFYGAAGSMVHNNFEASFENSSNRLNTSELYIKINFLRRNKSNLFFNLWHF